MSLILSGTDGLSDVDGSAATPAIRGTDANTGIFFGTDIIGFSEGGVEAMRINASGNLQTIATIGVGNATPSTSGAGITFPATESASSDANTLDDYEEGTWTPATNLAGTLTIISANGTYTKVGRLVTINFDTALSSTNTSQSNSTLFTLTGLPFYCGVGGARSAVITERATGYVSPTAAHTFYCTISPGYNLLNMIEVNYNGSYANQTQYSGCFTNIYTGGTFYLQGTLSFFV